ncbi:C-C motif chemokine 4 homolog [Seriola lalandi dorsalis]|uniref:C-C motif chemokine 4 homolog n=1 Tax=Seriola lalandi dorsalis TaxID=1841481 RepID=UPI000C6F63B7|nr:C-C motif chemokine 4 homolog [Seriola lalandi dorsalis]XP_056243844.1 C-C motif chemokine 4 homolog [Seriola aureovittata]
MKTSCLTLGLLLLLAVCQALPKALQYNTAPADCCFNFYTRSLPLKFVTGITESHSSCPMQAFIVHTLRGKQICYSKTFQWVVDVYNQLHGNESSSQQH